MYNNIFQIDEWMIENKNLFIFYWLLSFKMSIIFENYTNFNDNMFYRFYSTLYCDFSLMSHLIILKTFYDLKRDLSLKL